MTTEEFSNEFDTLINSHVIPRNELLNFDEYEKSVYLTKAQEELVLSLYNGKNQFGDSFEKTEEARRSLGNLIKTYTTSVKKTGYTGVSQDSVFFNLPDDIWFITYEAVDFNDSNINCVPNLNITVTPVTQDEYHRLKNNPFRGTTERRALRLDVNDNVVEIVSKYNVGKYLVRYLAKPKPIVLTELTDGLSINNIKYKSECELNPVLHRPILERAVQMALSSRAVITEK